MTMVQTPYQEKYSVHQERRETLLSLIQRQQKLLYCLDMDSWKGTLEQLEQRVKADSFKVLVIGEFKRGKSTFINALLGDEVLPTYAKPCTAIITEVKWGNDKRAILHYSQDEKGFTKSPVEIAVGQIEDYVVIKDNVDEIKNNSYQKVELFWNLDLCKNNVTIIDSPGLNDHDTREKITTEYLSEVDAILFVMSCEVLASKSEIEFIDSMLKSKGHEHILFVCNRINQIKAKEQQDIKRHAYFKLQELTKLGQEGIFFIDALGALEGRLNGDKSRVEQSGVPQLEEVLEEFLTTQRGKIKILQPAKEAQSAVREAREIIIQEEQLVKAPLQELWQRYADEQQILNEREKQGEKSVICISNFIDDTKLIVNQKVKQFYNNITDDKIFEWIQEYKNNNCSVKLFNFELFQKQVKIEEVKKFIDTKIESEYTTWQSSELQPLLAARIEGFVQELDEKAKTFVKQAAENLRFELVYGASVSIFFNHQEAKESLMERVFTRVPIITFIAAILFKLLILIMLPIYSIFQTWKNDSTIDKFKEVVKKESPEQLSTIGNQKGDELSDAVAKELTKIEDAVNQEFCQEIQSLRGQVNLTLAEKQKEEDKVEQKVSELANIRSQLDKIDTELDELITEVTVL